MNLRTPCIILAAAAIAAATLAVAFGDEPLTERVVRTETARAFPALADELNRQPTEVRLAFLDYADDEALVLNARLALLRYPDSAPRIIALYGASEDFRDILRMYGPAVIPPIDYFLHHEPTTLRVLAMVTPSPTPTASSVGADSGESAAVEGAAPDDPAASLTPEVRGHYAIHFIAETGHDFLGQFVTTPDGEVAWVQSERMATGIKRFFTSGLTRVETKWRVGDDITAGDYAWATVDVMVPIAIFKLARAGRVATGTARSTRGIAAATRSGATLGRTGRLVAAGGTLAGIGYVAMNPGVLNSIGAGIAEALGLPPWLVSAGLWFVLLLPLLIVLRIGQRWILRPIAALLGGLIALLDWCRRRIAARTATRARDVPAATG